MDSGTITLDGIYPKYLVLVEGIKNDLHTADLAPCLQ